MKTIMATLILYLFPSIDLSIMPCSMIDKIPFTIMRDFSTELNYGIKVKNAVCLTKLDYKKLFEYEMIDSDTCYLFGKFKINENRTGVYSLRNTYECDHRIELVELLVIDNCKLVDSKKILFQDNHIGVYEISSEVNKDFSELTIKETSSSEYATETGEMDTLFINTYTIDLKSKSLDTIYKKSRIQVLTSPQKQ
ncbi:hypothetical protein J2X31_000881 [Flavobacterium arsenatis]|uniref:Uncharacterized protein n=1 Tax=Flavobacterium arsenatis TaxID=1484332 RepID=A0ABU1TLZ2_9FLAO|nr:hypothetical protein [Flavobacterium arsenatis]MDR6966881.1 hypothetical protein [Flavobacterium arsenatis]